MTWMMIKMVIIIIVIITNYTYINTHTELPIAHHVYHIIKHCTSLTNTHTCEFIDTQIHTHIHRASMAGNCQSLIMPCLMHTTNYTHTITYLTKNIG